MKNSIWNVESPKVAGYYNVTIIDPEGTNPVVDCDEWLGKSWRVWGAGVLAWTDLPKPYEPPKVKTAPKADKPAVKVEKKPAPVKKVTPKAEAKKAVVAEKPKVEVKPSPKVEPAKTEAKPVTKSAPKVEAKPAPKSEEERKAEATKRILADPTISPALKAVLKRGL